MPFWHKISLIFSLSIFLSFKEMMTKSHNLLDLNDPYFSIKRMIKIITKTIFYLKKTSIGILFAYCLIGAFSKSQIFQPIFLT